MVLNRYTGNKTVLPHISVMNAAFGFLMLFFTASMIYVGIQEHNWLYAAFSLCMILIGILAKNHEYYWFKEGELSILCFWGFPTVTIHPDRIIRIYICETERTLRYAAPDPWTVKLGADRYLLPFAMLCTASDDYYSVQGEILDCLNGFAIQKRNVKAFSDIVSHTECMIYIDKRVWNRYTYGLIRDLRIDLNRIRVIEDSFDCA